MLKNFAKIALILAIAAPVFAQNQPGYDDKLTPRVFYLDFVPFADTASDSLLVEAYYKAYSRALTFEKWGERFKASYEINIVINHKGKQVTGVTRDGDLFADSYEMTRANSDFIIDKFEFKLPPENYEIVGMLTDMNSKDVLEYKDEMKLKDFGKKLPYISGIEFVRESAVTDDSTQFHKDGVRLIPSVSRVFGYSEPSMEIYYQIYNSPDFTADYLVTYEILQDDKSFLADTTLFPSTGPVTSRNESFNVDFLLPGVYDLALKVETPGGKLKIQEKAPFIVEWSVMGIVKNDYKTAVEQLRYIASKDEMKKLKKAPEDKRLEMWNAFWAANDPSPGTPENELRDEYYQRLRYSDLNFGHFGRDGWKTDMGMVYVSYGSPDEIERHPFDINSKPYQIWYYYEQKRRFVFVDLNGYGDYELQYPYDGDITRTR